MKLLVEDLKEWSLYVQKALLEPSIWCCDLWRRKRTTHLKSLFEILAVSSNSSLAASDWGLNFLMSEFKKQQKTLP